MGIVPQPVQPATKMVSQRVQRPSTMNFVINYDTLNSAMTQIKSMRSVVKQEVEQTRDEEFTLVASSQRYRRPSVAVAGGGRRMSL